MSEPPPLPPGLIAVDLSKQTLLVLTEAEYLRGLRRGKAWRRTVALTTREARGSPP